jgi:PrcB C-terminal
MKNMMSIVGVALLVVAVGAGVFFFSREAAPTSAPIVETKQVAVEVPFTELARGAQSTIDKRTNYIITSPEQFRDLWGLVGAKGRIPDVDFSKSAVAAVFAGEQPTGGYGIAVSRVEDTSARKVLVTLTQPDNGCALKKATTTPYQIVELPNTTLQLTHEDISTTTGCPK